MTTPKFLLVAALAFAATACDQGANSPVQSSQSTTPPPAPAPAASTPEAAEVDYPGSIDVFSKVASGKGAPLRVMANDRVSGRYVVERDGTLLAFGTRIGTYRGESDGSLKLSLCLEGQCQDAEKPLAGARDNDYLVFELPQAIEVTKGMTLDYAFARSADSSKRVAVWTYPKLEGQTGIIDPSGATLDMVPRLSTHLQ